jgi:thiamine biosynthesis lipoprotein
MDIRRLQRRVNWRQAWLLGSTFLVGLVSLSAQAQWYEREATAMGTRIQVELWSEDPGVAEQALSAVVAEMHRVDAAFSPYKADSELSVLNTNAAKGWMTVSPELFALLERSAWVSKLTGGAFDITYASAGRYYNYRRGQAPDAKTLEALVQHINYRNVELRAQSREVRYAMEQVYVDLGGIAKGHAVDGAIAILQDLGISQASVAAGGDSRILGDRRGQPWTVGVRHPRNPDAIAVLLPLEDTAVSTSGDYERFFESDGVRYHHILDPETGSSAQGSVSVTILGAKSLLTDALSTSVFVLGPQKGLELINRLEGIDAIIIDASGKMRYSDGLAGLQ